MFSVCNFGAVVVVVLMVTCKHTVAYICIRGFADSVPIGPLHSDGRGLKLWVFVKTKALAGAGDTHYGSVGVTTPCTSNTALYDCFCFFSFCASLSLMHTHVLILGAPI